MKKSSTVLVLAVVIVLASAMAVWAVQSPSRMPAKKKAPETRELTGTVVSFTPTQLVLSYTVKGSKKKVEGTFVLDPETRHEGTLKVGALVTVNYRVENSKDVATLVQVKEQGQKPKY